MRLHILRVVAKDVPQDRIAYKWPGIPVIIEPDVPLLELHPMDGNSRVKMAQDPFHHFHRDAPDTKESQDMIDAEPVEIIAHVRETALPPGVTVFLHFLPVVGRKTPVLPLDGEVVGRSAGLHIHMVKPWFHPGITAVAVDTDGDIALQDDAVLVRMIDRIAQLEVKMVLDEILQNDRIKMSRTG